MAFYDNDYNTKSSNYKYISLTEDPQIQTVIFPTLSPDSEMPQTEITESTQPDTQTPDQTKPNTPEINSVTSKVKTLYIVPHKHYFKTL